MTQAAPTPSNGFLANAMPTLLCIAYFALMIYAARSAS